MRDYFLRPWLHRPGKALKTYQAYKKKSTLTKSGRPVEVYDFDNPICTFYGTISRASQKEQIEYQQLGHKVSHEVIVYHRVPVEAGDCLLLGDRKFFVHDIRDPGELGEVFCIMTEESETSGRNGNIHNQSSSTGQESN